MVDFCLPRISDILIAGLPALSSSRTLASSSDVFSLHLTSLLLLSILPGLRASTVNLRDYGAAKTPTLHT